MSILKPFTIPLGFTATATICPLMILKNCLRGYLLCQQISWQNFSFYFVLNLDTGPKSIFLSTQLHLNTSVCSTTKIRFFAASNTQKIRGPGFMSKSSEKLYISSIFTLSIMYFSQQNYSLNVKMLVYFQLWSQQFKKAVFISVLGIIHVCL